MGKTKNVLKLVKYCENSSQAKVNNECELGFPSRIFLFEAVGSLSASRYLLWIMIYFI